MKKILLKIRNLFKKKKRVISKDNILVNSYLIYFKK
jgi:hypothetical protein